MREEQIFMMSFRVGKGVKLILGKQMEWRHVANPSIYGVSCQRDPVVQHIRGTQGEEMFWDLRVRRDFKIGKWRSFKDY